MRITMQEKAVLLQLARDLKRGAALCKCDSTELGELEDLMTHCLKDLVKVLPSAANRHKGDGYLGGFNP